MIELSIMNHGSGFTDTLRALLDQFETAHPVEVRLRVLAWDAGWADLVKVALYDDGPHLSEVGSTWVNEFVSMNALRPFIGAEIARLGGSSQYLPSAWNVGKPIGHAQPGVMSWAIPWMADTRLIHYRREIFDRVGIDPASAFQSPDALLKTLAALQSKGVLIPIVLPMGRGRNTLHILASWLWGAGGDFVSADAKRVTFTLPHARAGIYKYFELGRYLSPEARGLDEVQADSLFGQGRAAMTISGAWLRAAHDATAAQALLPGVSFVGGTHLVIWKHARETDLAIALVKHLIGADSQTTIVRQSGQLPTRLDVLTQAPFSSDPFYQMVRRGLQSARSFPSFALWGLVENRLVEACAGIWADVLAATDPDLHAIVDRHLDEAAERLTSTLEYY
jgi:multiple sugar transport system substrate-binding protein